MNRQEKQVIIDAVKGDFQQSQAVFLVGMQGLTVESVQVLRKKLHSSGGKLRVAKNTLLKIATSGSQSGAVLAPYFKQQVAVIFAHDEVPGVAKLLYETSKENEKLILVAGTLQERFLAASDIKILATLPPKEVVAAQLCGALNAPMANTVGLMQQLVVRLLVVLKQIAEKQQ